MRDPPIPYTKVTSRDTIMSEWGKDRNCDLSGREIVFVIESDNVTIIKD